LCMTAVPQPHENWKTMLLRGEPDADHISQFATLLATMQQRALEQREAIAAAFADTSFFESLRLEPYYAYTAAQVPQASAFLHTLIDETRSCRLTLVHGDYSPKNILIHQNRLILLDHEVIHFGDPAFDLGFSLTHLLSKAHYRANRRSEFAEAARLYWQVYADATGTVGEIEARAVRHTLACLLARVKGRSPLEYLSDEARERQQTAVLPLMQTPPQTIPDLIGAFIERL